MSHHMRDLRRTTIDTLHIADLKIATHIGVYAWEQRIKQNLLIDLIIPINIAQCQDDLANTIDYADLCQQVTTFVSSRSFKLIETVAEEVSAFIKTHFAIQSLTIKISKPHAVPNAGLIQITRDSSH